jgi:hypothetical protein
MTYLDAFTIDELEQILAQCKEELLNGSITSINSLGTSATFTRIPVERRIEMVQQTLQKKDPNKYGRRVKAGWAFFNY